MFLYVVTQLLTFTNSPDQIIAVGWKLVINNLLNYLKAILKD